MVKFQIIAVYATLQQFIYHTSPFQNGEKLTTNKQTQLNTTQRHSRV